MSHDDSVSLGVYASHVSCHYALRFARRCFRSAALHRWHFHGEQDYTGRFRLTRGRTTIRLDDAGGTVRCLAR